MGLGENDRAIEWLEKAYQDRDHWMETLKVHPMLDRAIELLGHVTALEGSHLDDWMRLGEAYRARGRTQDARAGPGAPCHPAPGCRRPPSRARGRAASAVLP